MKLQQQQVSRPFKLQKQMALDDAFQPTTYINLAVPAGIVSGDPVSVGFIVGVAQTTRDSSGNATIKIQPTWAVSIPVIGQTTISSPVTNSAVAVGDKLYVDNTTKTISKDATGKFFGYALGTVLSGATTTITVLLGSA